MASCNSPRAEHAKRFRRAGIFHADRDVGQQFLLQPVAQVARGNELAFAAGKGRGVHRENHGERGLVDEQRLERRGILEVGDAFADLNAFHARDGDDVSRGDLFGFVAFESAEGEKLRDLRGLNGARSSLAMPTSSPRCSVP